jgi:hypothetical protein
MINALTETDVATYARGLTLQLRYAMRPINLIWAACILSLGIASSAWAQTPPAIQPTGPNVIMAGDTYGAYTATVNLPSLQDYAVQVLVYRGTNPTPINSFELWTYSPTSLTNYFSGLCTSQTQHHR